MRITKKDGRITPGDRVGSSDILDMLYDSDYGEKEFLEVARRNLGFKFVFDPEDDFALIDEFKRKYGPWAEYPGCPRDEWCSEAAKMETTLGYWEWVLHACESGDSDTCPHCGIY
jgi:hypothetical protein